MDFYEIKLLGLPKTEFAYNVAVNNYKNRFPTTENLLEISLCLENNIIAEFKNGDKRVFSPDSIMIVTKNTSCITYAEKAGIQRHITFGVTADYLFKKSSAKAVTADELKEIEQRVKSGDTLLLPDFTYLGKTAREVEDVITQAVSSFYSSSPAQGLESTALWFRLCRILTEFTLKKIRRLHFDRLPSDERYIEAAILYINGHLAEKIKVEDIALACGISQGYLQNLFKAVTSQTVIEYINREKVELVKSYTKDGRTTLFEAAQLVGIEDCAYMSRLFKKVSGVSFKKFLKLNRQKSSNTILEYNN